MKINLAAKFSWLVILALTVVFLAGCRTTKPIDWNSRVGSYTYDQAVTDLGPPDKQSGLSDGKTVAEWITRRHGGTSFTFGTGFFGGSTGVGVSQTVGTGYRNRVLKLVFSTNDVLTAWSKNY